MAQGRRDDDEPVAIVEGRRLHGRHFDTRRGAMGEVADGLSFCILVQSQALSSMTLRTVPTTGAIEALATPAVTQSSCRTDTLGP